MYHQFVYPDFGRSKLGYADIGTTMNIYTDATQELKVREFAALVEYLDKNMPDREEAPGNMAIRVRQV